MIYVTKFIPTHEKMGEAMGDTPLPTYWRVRELVVQFRHSHSIEAGTLRMLELKDHEKILILVELWI